MSYHLQKNEDLAPLLSRRTPLDGVETVAVVRRRDVDEAAARKALGFMRSVPRLVKLPEAAGGRESLYSKSYQSMDEVLIAR